MVFYKQNYENSDGIVLDLEPSDLRKDMEKTRKALETAYSGFNNCTDFDLIDGYVYEINALQRKLSHLTALLEKEWEQAPPKRKKRVTLPALLFRQKRSPH